MLSAPNLFENSLYANAKSSSQKMEEQKYTLQANSKLKHMQKKKKKTGDTFQCCQNFSTYFCQIQCTHIFHVFHTHIFYVLLVQKCMESIIQCSISGFEENLQEGYFYHRRRQCLRSHTFKGDRERNIKQKVWLLLL